MSSSKERVEKRNLLSSFFVTLLIGVAYSEMLSSGRASLITGGDWRTLLMALTFFLVSMRFFIGNQLHLLSDAIANTPGLVWLYDLMNIIVQSCALVFMGSFCNVPANDGVPIGYFEWLLLLYVIDVVWIISQWALGEFLESWKREPVPWEWAKLNTGLIVLMAALASFMDDIYSFSGLLLLFVLNLGGFIIDVILVDKYVTLGQD